HRAEERQGCRAPSARSANRPYGQRRSQRNGDHAEVSRQAGSANNCPGPRRGGPGQTWRLQIGGKSMRILVALLAFLGLVQNASALCNSMHVSGKRPLLIAYGPGKVVVTNLTAMELFIDPPNDPNHYLERNQSMLVTTVTNDAKVFVNMVS